jgi:hypothetical protein
MPHSPPRVRHHTKCASVLKQKKFDVTQGSLYKRDMSDIIGNDAALTEWRQLCQAAFVEPDPARLIERIAEARSAVLDRIEDGFSRSPQGEQLELRDALQTLSSLHRMAERDNGKQRKAG